jgi:AcrR family transcriptional regulator
MRADARRNRARLLEVAETVFATRGTATSTEEVARAAGVGIGTLFRHFPNKEALLEAVFVAQLERLVTEADAATAAPDVGPAFFAYLERMVDRSATKTALADALATAGVDVSGVASAPRANLHRALQALLNRAQEAGAVRRDIGSAELLAVLVGAARAAEFARADAELRARALDVFADGLRPRAGA